MHVMSRSPRPVPGRVALAPLVASMRPCMRLRRGGHARIRGGGLRHLLGLGDSGEGREGDDGAEADRDKFIDGCSSS